MTPHTTTGYRYAPIPEALLYDPAISDKAVRVYAALARHGMDPASCFPSHARIAELIGAAQRSIQRPLRDLEKAGWIVRVRRRDETGARTTDGFHVHTEAAHHSAPPTLDSVVPPAQPDRATPRAEREPGNESQDEREGADGAAPEPKPENPAVTLCQRVWERSNPKPATKFVAAVMIAEKLLAAGWTRDQVGKAMLAAPTISTGAVEFQLAKMKGGGTVGHDPNRGVDTDRDRPAGRIDFAQEAYR